MASPEYLGSLYFSAAALALATVGLEMITGLALSNARRNTCEQQTCLGGTLRAIRRLGALSAHVSQLASASRCTMPMRPAPITPACVQVGIACTHRVALHMHRIASGLTDVQHPIGQSHADRAPPSGGDAGPARAGQLQRMGGHGQRHSGDADAHHVADLCK